MLNYVKKEEKKIKCYKRKAEKSKVSNLYRIKSLLR